MDVIRIIDKVGLNSAIENATFENALIVGPAVLAPITHTTIADCMFDGDPDSIFIEVPEGRRVTGIVGLINTTFRKCEFRNIAIMGTREAIAEFRKGFKNPPPEAAPQPPRNVGFRPQE
jgi:hypothetical protein